MPEALIVPGEKNRSADQPPIAATGKTFDVHEWSGGGPGYIHVHYEDDEAWHVLEGTLFFRLPDKEAQAPREEHKDIMRRFESEIVE